MDLTLKLKPSLLGQYYEKQCDEYLVYSALDEDGYAKVGWTPPRQFQETAASQAGKEWEKILLDNLMDDETCEVINIENHKDRDTAYAETVQALKNLNSTDKPVYLYQACIKVTPTFREQHIPSDGNAAGNVVFSNFMFPDFIKAEYNHDKDQYQLTVIDAKNASFVKIGAEIQIALYVKILKGLLSDEGIANCFVNEKEGIVWNREKITDNRLEHYFDLEDASVEIELFFSERLPSILKVIDHCDTGLQLQKELDYRIAQTCEYCDHFESCRNHCINERNVHLMPYMTKAAQDRVRGLIDKGILEDESIDAVMALLKDDPDRLTEDCGFWKTVKNNIDAYENGLRAYYDGRKERFPKSGTSISFPINQHFALILTAQQDVSTGRNYAYAWLLKPGKNIDIFQQGLNKYGYVDLYESKDKSPGKGTYYDSVVAETKDTEEFDRVDRIFVEKIYDLLHRIDQYDDDDKKLLQVYVMDNYERFNIESALFNMLVYLDPIEDQDLLEKVVAILFWMQGERLITDSEQQPEECIETPVSVLTTEIARLYVLPEGVAYNLRQVASLFSPGFNFDTDHNGYIGTLTNVVEGMHIVNVWEEKDPRKKQMRLDRLSAHLRKRLHVESSIISGIQKDNGRVIQLGVWPMRYFMQEPNYPEYPEIAKLDFENNYEDLLAYRQIRASRMAGIQNAIDKGDILWLEYSGDGDTFYVLNKDTYIGREWFVSWICEDTPENRDQIMLLKDGMYKPWYDYNIKGTRFYAVDGRNSYNFSDAEDAVTVSVKAGIPSYELKKGKRYLFFEFYADMNSGKTAVGLSGLTGRQELLDPQAMSEPTGVICDDAVKKICERYWSPDGYSFSPSQKEAFFHLLEQKLTVLVGPPASGKTDFIARALITIASYYKETEGRNLKIMVTAQSHSAIENVLLKLENMLRKENHCGINVYKVDRFDDEKAFAGKKVTIIGKSSKSRPCSVASKMDEDKIQIFGMTAFAAFTEFFSDSGKMRPFDLIVMDEASQVRAMDAFLNLECSDCDTRYLLVGDDDQLPAIIGGKYRETPGEKFIHGSIFHMYLTGLGEDHPDIVRLSDNFRMNGILCKYPSKAIYGPDYKAFNEEIENQQISLNKEPEKELLATILDEDYPLVFCELSGISREQHSAEVQLVTELVHELWDNQMNPETNRLASTDGNFWRDITSDKGIDLTGACGIISPHHEHINRLKTSIASDLGIGRGDIYIGTVDKLQGKERKTVIVSYGVSENEKVMSESEFIFSRNRFNVSITRGKAKTIIFLSDVIAESNLTTNAMTANDENLKKGIGFIHGFSSYMKKAEPGEELKFDEYPFVIGNVSLKIWRKRKK